MAKCNIRFSSIVDVTLRSSALYRGDLMRMVIDAFTRVDARTVPLADYRRGEVRATAITQLSVPPDWLDEVRAIALGRGCSVTRLVNSVMEVALDIRQSSARTESAKAAGSTD